MPAEPADQPIPEQWRIAVCHILQKGSIGREIEQTLRSLREWEAAFPAAFTFNLIDALRQTLLRPDVRGKAVLADEPGETWAFFFWYETRKMYGKVCLRLCGNKIKIISAHIPLKGESL
jgi:hypothetical protein